MRYVVTLIPASPAATAAVCRTDVVDFLIKRRWSYHRAVGGMRGVKWSRRVRKGYRGMYEGS